MNWRKLSEKLKSAKIGRLAGVSKIVSAAYVHREKYSEGYEWRRR